MGTHIFIPNVCFLVCCSMRFCIDSNDGGKMKNIDIDKIADKIREQFGKDSMMILDPSLRVNIEIDSIPTGSIELDNILEIGGVPRGRIVELYGLESSGKTTLALHIISNAQKKGLVAAFIDAEHALDIKYAKAIGVDISKLLFNQPKSGENALNIVIELIKTRKIGVIVIDSVAALVPEKELSGDMDSQQMGAQARMMGKALRKMTHIVKKTNTSIIFINQIRDKIGVMFGERVVTPGGKALKFWAHLRLCITRIKTIIKGKIKKANLTRVVVKKSKISTPYRQCEFTIVYGKGIINGDE